MKNCPHCNSSLIEIVMMKTLMRQEQELTTSIPCPNCNAEVTVTLPNFLQSNHSIPFGVFLGILIANMVLYTTNGTMMEKIQLVVALCLFVIFAYWVIGCILTKIN